MVKTPCKSSAPEPSGRLLCNLVCNIRDSSQLYSHQIVDIDLFHTKVTFGGLDFCLGEGESENV